MTPEKPSWSIAYGYIRFSILVESKGDSPRRQTSGFDRYRAGVHLTPPTLTFRDPRGVSVPGGQPAEASAGGFLTCGLRRAAV